MVLIGHSQGTAMLNELIKSEIDNDAATRALLVSAVLTGGRITVPKGRDVGGDYQHIPACRSNTQTGCVIAYNSFNETPPADSRFGRVPGGDADKQILCTNPTALAGGSGTFRSYQRTEPFPGLLGTLAKGLYDRPPPQVSTPWVASRDVYTGQCVEEGGASFLRITGIDAAPHLKPMPDPTWGLHLADMNIANGNLVEIVREQAQAYQPN